MSAGSSRWQWLSATIFPVAAAIALAAILLGDSSRKSAAVAGPPAGSYLYSKTDKALNKRLDVNSKRHGFIECPGSEFKVPGSEVWKSAREMEMELDSGSSRSSNGSQRFVEAIVKAVPCRTGGIKWCCETEMVFRPNTTDFKVYKQMFMWHLMRYFYAIFENREPKYILDAGANVGYSTMLFKLMWPGAVVVSVEPDPDNYEALVQQTRELDGVHTLNAGLWGRKARIAQTAEINGAWGKIFREMKWYETGGMQAYGVQDIAELYNVPAFDLVKIDIEGAESMVFGRWAQKSWILQADVISLEVHDHFSNYFGLEDVSSHIDAAMSRLPFTVVSDNEHVMYLSTERGHSNVGQFGPPVATRICLNMIARDESADILSSLEAAGPHLSGYAVCDTGSTDATPAIAAAFFRDAGIPGQVHHHPWHDFAHNRNLCLDAGAAALGTACDYWLLLDADQVLVAPRAHDSANVKDNAADNDTVLLSSLTLTSDSYLLEERSHNTVYSNVRLISTRLPWRYHGTTHEYIAAADPDAHFRASDTLPPGFYSIHDSNMGRGGRVGKFERDVALLEAVPPGDADYTRSRFYMGNSYKSLGRREEAIQAWALRVRLGGWAEEVYVAALEIGLTLERGLGDEEWRLQGATRELLLSGLKLEVGERPTADAVLAVLDFAAATLPYRQEAPLHAARVHRTLFSNMTACYNSAAEARRRGPHTHATLFSDSAVTRFQIDDELCTCAYYVEGRRGEGRRACERLEAALHALGPEKTAAQEQQTARAAANKWYLGEEGGTREADEGHGDLGGGNAAAERAVVLEAEVAA